MNRYVRGATAALLVAGGLGSLGCMNTCGGGAGAGGKNHGDGAILRSFYDPCWPERYNAAARDEVLDPLRKQVFNGHVLHQTVYNWYFEPGTDTLNAAGIAKLDSIVKARPQPDPKVYLQTARDLPVTPDTMDKLAALRDELDGKRAAVIQKYMAAQPSLQPTVYEVYVHDPVVPSVDSNFAGNSYRAQGQGYRGGIGGGSGTAVTATGGGGPAPAASSIGTGPTGGPGTTGGAPGGSASGGTPR